MKYRRALKWHISILFILIFIIACDLGSLLYTESEIEALFTFSFEQLGQPLENGSQAIIESPLELKWSSDDGAPEPVRFEIVLLAADRAEYDRLAFIKDENTEPPELVSERRSFLPGQYTEIPLENFEELFFYLPEDLPKGYYEIMLTAFSARAEKLSSKKTVLLAGVSKLDGIIISSLPAELGPGETAMFRLDYGAHEDLLPWIRWSVDGVEHEYGPASEYMDRFLWTAPDEAGVHIVQVEFYPFPPPASLTKPVFISAEMKVPVSAKKARGRQEWEPELSTVMDAPFSNLGAGSSILGKIYPEAMRNSFGMVMGKGSGILLDYNLLKDIGREASFLTFEIAPGPQGYESDDPEGAALLRIVNGSEAVLEAGLNHGRPYIKNSVSYDEIPGSVPGRAGRLVISFDYKDGWLSTDWYFSNSLLGSAGIESSLEALEMARASIIAGDAGLPAIYGRLGFGQGPWPWLELNARAEYGDRFISMTDFTRRSMQILPDEPFRIDEIPDESADWYELVIGIASGNAYLGVKDYEGPEINLSPGKAVVKISADWLKKDAELSIFHQGDDALVIEYIILARYNASQNLVLGP